MRDYDQILKVNYGLEPFVEFVIHNSGETHINLNPVVYYNKDFKTLVHAHINSSKTLLETLHLLDALKHRGFWPDLYLPYCPYSRADRVVGNGGGDSYGINLFSNLFDGTVKKLITLDLHSSKTAYNLVEAFEVENLIPYDKFIDNLKIRHKISDFCLVSPDEGCRDKVEFFAQKYNVPHFKLEKKRDQSQRGKIISYQPINEYPGTQSAIILDDICDGGGTFIHAASCIPRPSRLFLGITHGIFSKGLDPLLAAGFEGIITTDSFSQHNNISKVLQVVGVNQCL